MGHTKLLDDNGLSELAMLWYVYIMSVCGATLRISARYGGVGFREAQGSPTWTFLAETSKTNMICL